MKQYIIPDSIASWPGKLRVPAFRREFRPCQKAKHVFRAPLRSQRAVWHRLRFRWDHREGDLMFAVLQ